MTISVDMYYKVSKTAKMDELIKQWHVIAFINGCLPTNQAFIL